MSDQRMRLLKRARLRSLASLAVGLLGSLSMVACDLSPEPTVSGPEPLGPPNTGLTITIVGAGSVTSDPAGIDCGSQCSGLFSAGQTVTLIPTPAAGQRLFAWSGDPDCNEGTLRMDAPRNCTAHFAPVPVPVPAGSGWTPLGSPLTATSEVDPSPSLSRDGDNPLVAYVERAPNDAARLWVKRLEGNTWVALGGTALNAASTTSASEPSLATTASGQPYVAWIQGNATQRNLFVARFNGSAWESVGEPGVPLNYFMPSIAFSPSLVLDSQNQPVVAWIEDGAVKLKRFDGAWRPVASATTSLRSQGPESADASGVRLAIDPMGDSLLIAFRQPFGPMRERGVVASTVAGTITAGPVGSADGFTRLGGDPLPTAASTSPLFAAMTNNTTTAGGGTGSQVIVAAAAMSPVTLIPVGTSVGTWPPFGTGTLVRDDPRQLAALAGASRGPVYGVAFSLVDSVSGTAETRVSTLERPALLWQAATPPLATTEALHLHHLSLDPADGRSPRVAGSFHSSRDTFGARVWRYYP